jgi:hypothetical protein
MRRFVSSVCLALVVSLLPVRAHGAGVETASGEQKRAAQKMFEAADGLYESGRFDEAAQAFRASYELVASPNSRLMIARSLRELQRYDDAFKEYQGTIADAEASGGRYPDTLSAARAEADALKGQLAYLVIDASAADATAELRINGKSVKWVPGEPVAMKAGKAEVELRLANGQTRHELFDLKPAEKHTLSAKSAPVPPPALPVVAPTQATNLSASPKPESHSNGLRTAAYVAGGVGALGLTSFGVFGYLDRSTYSDLKSKCSSGACASAQSSDIDAGRRYQLFANIGLGVAALGVATATTLFLVSSPGHSQERKVTLRLGPGNVVVGGKF